jgi:hypothetical protein
VNLEISFFVGRSGRRRRQRGNDGRAGHNAALQS